MRITNLEVIPTVVPNASPGWMGDVHFVVVIARSDDGAEGIGLSATSRPVFFRTLATGVQELAELVTEMPVAEPERIHSAIVPRESFFGPGGVLPMAAAAIDTAIWDLIGKHAQLPLWRLLGGADRRVRVYDSGSLRPDAGLTELQEAAAAAIARGHRAIKMRLGVHRDAPASMIVKRVAAVREAIGPDVALMLDVNQAWTVSRSLRIIEQLEPLQLEWVEDPTRMTNFEAQAAITAATTVAICAGEYQSGPSQLFEMLKARAADILMVDLMHVGGITPFRRVAAAADLFDIPVATHLFPEICAHLIGAIPNPSMVECMPWSQPLFEETPTVVDGFIELGEEPGLGLRLDKDFIDAHRV